MKKIIKFLCLVLAFAMLALSLASCTASAGERVAAAMLKAVIAKKTDCTASLDVTLTSGGVTTHLPINAVIKKDSSNAYNPLAYIDVSGTGVKTTAYYKDGYLYSNVYGVKTKTQMSYEDMEKTFSNIADITSVFSAKKDNIDDSFVITENADGSLTVRMTVTKQEFAEKLADFSGALASGLGENGTVEISDTVFELTVDKTNSITSVKADMEITVTYGGNVTSISYSIDFRYNPIGEGFKVPEPANIGAYKAA